MEESDTVVSLDEFSKAVFSAVIESTKHVNGLPTSGSEFDYWTSYDSFTHLTHHHGMKILDLIQFILSKHNLKTDIASKFKLLDVEERFDLLTDASDQLMEKIGINLDDASGFKKSASLVVSSKLNNMTLSSASSSSTNFTSPQSSFSKKIRHKASNYTLMTSKVLTRSQDSFKDKIDNSNKPFMPKLTEKPNAILPLKESLKLSADVLDVNGDMLMEYPHPYQHELDEFKPTPSTLERVVPQVPKSVEETPLTYIDTEPKFDELIEKLKSSKEIAVDLEHHSFRSFQGFTCLMQLSTRSEDFIVDTLALRHYIHKINCIFTDPNIVKVFHGSDSDVVWLQKDFGVYLVNMFDTGQAARVLGLPFFSFAYILQHYCNVKADKQYQLADWRIRPLPEELIKYAREDTHYLLYIYDCLKNDLLYKNNNNHALLLNVYSNSNNLCKKKYQKPRLTDTSHRDVYMNLKARSSSSKQHLNERQMEVLKRLYAWRDKMARMEDESTGYVLPNQMMLQLAEYLPKEPEGILACCKPLPLYVKKELHDIHRIICQVRDLPTSYFLSNNTSTLDSSSTSSLTTTSTPSNETMTNKVMRPNKLEHPINYNLFITKYKSNILNGLYADDEGDDEDNESGETECTTTTTTTTMKHHAGKNKRDTTILLKENINQQQQHQPRISDFFNVLCQKNKIVSTNQQATKVDMIRSKLLSPFLPFLPENFVDKKSLASFTKWKLMPHTTKLITSLDCKKTSVSKKSSIDELDASENETILTIRDKIHSEIKDEHNINNDASTSSGKRKLNEDEILQTPFSGITKQKKAKKLKDDTSEDGCGSGGKEFVAKGYKSEDMQKILESGSQEHKDNKNSHKNNKKRQFDPLDDTPQYQPKKVTKPHGSHSNNKSYSYKNETTPSRNASWNRSDGRGGGGSRGGGSGGGGGTKISKIPWPGSK